MRNFYWNQGYLLLVLIWVLLFSLILPLLIFFKYPGIKCRPKATFLATCL